MKKRTSATITITNLIPTASSAIDRPDLLLTNNRNSSNNNNKELGEHTGISASGFPGMSLELAFIFITVFVFYGGQEILLVKYEVRSYPQTSQLCH
jgi:hypothetical protein